jgi:hypothetical protein
MPDVDIRNVATYRTAAKIMSERPSIVIYSNETCPLLFMSDSIVLFPYLYFITVFNIAV